MDFKVRHYKSLPKTKHLFVKVGQHVLVQILTTRCHSITDKLINM